MSMAAMPEEMQQWTKRNQDKRQRAEQMRAVLAQEKERRNGRESKQGETRARAPEGFLPAMMFVIHDVLRRSERPALSSGRRARRASRQA